MEFPMKKRYDKSPVKAKKTEVDASIKNMTTKSKIAFMIPETDNSGKPFDEELFGWIDKSLCELGGGFHFLPAVGAWSPVKKVPQREDCRKYYVGIDEKEIPALFRLLEEAIDAFQQEALYIEYAGKVIILSNEEVK